MGPMISQGVEEKQENKRPLPAAWPFVVSRKKRCERELFFALSV